ncbi:MAG: hypothetical protein NTU77_11665 [Actinobacteria bacterium]|nr:hypothetical protein [Actinomycetota bacterium]
MRLPLRRMVVATVALGLAFGSMSGSALAHERVVLTGQHVTPAQGPLIQDGTIARAAFAEFTGTGQQRGLRVRFTSGQELRMELLIADTPSASRLPVSNLPELIVIAPDGSRRTLAISERTPFFEPYSGTSFLYLARLRTKAQAGTYRVLVSSRSSTPVTAVIGIGYREVAGH